MTLPALPMSAVLGDHPGIIVKRPQIIGMPIHPQDHISTLRSISAIGASTRHILFPPEAHHAVSAVPCLRVDSSVVNEHRGLLVANAHDLNPKISLPSPIARFPTSGTSLDAASDYIHSAFMADSTGYDAPIRLEGQLLIADPTLGEGPFHHAVILLTEHSSEEGAFGLILNQPSNHHVSDFLEKEEFEALSTIPVHLGGPVSRENLSFAALWWSESASLCFETGISASGAIKHAKTPGVIVRAFLGYSGWSKGQLEGEIRHRSWIPAKPTEDLLTRDHDHSLWSETLRNLSVYHTIVAECPEDPGKN